MSEVASLIAFTFALNVTVIALAVVIPWASKLGVLYELHNLRDRLFFAAEANPELRRLKVFRAVDRGLAIMTHVTRDRPYFDALSLGAAIEGASKSGDVDSETVELYKRELQELSPELTALLLDCHKKGEIALAFRTVFGHPLMIVTFLGMLAVLPLIWTFRPRKDRAVKIARTEKEVEARGYGPCLEAA